MYIYKYITCVRLRICVVDVYDYKMKWIKKNNNDHGDNSENNNK